MWDQVVRPGVTFVRSNSRGLVALASALWAFWVYRHWRPSGPFRPETVSRHGGQPLLLRPPLDGLPSDETVDRVLEYFIHGSPTGEKGTLLALHGAQTTGNLFQILDQWGKLRGIRIISPTLPGFGLTTYMHPYLLSEWVKDMERLMEHLKVKQFDVLGTSLGSIHAVNAAALFEPKDSVRHLMLYVAFAPPSEDFDPLNGSVLRVFTRMKPAWFRKVMERLVIRPLMLTLLPSSSDVVRSLRWQWEGMSNCDTVIYQPWGSAVEALARTKCDSTSDSTASPHRQVWVISGKKDTAATPANQHRLVSLIPGSILVEYDGEHDEGIKTPALMASHLDMMYVNAAAPH